MAEDAILANLDENLPRLEAYDDIGNRTEAIEFHPSYHRLGKLIYGARTMADYQTPGKEMLQLAKVCLAAQLGESPHLCPLACTAGLIKSLQKVGSQDLLDRYLPGLLHPDYDANFVGAQFITEVQGGSDVGAGAVQAVEDPGHPGRYRIHGEKWFCSVIQADLFLLSARVESQGDGTRGLACFLVPRHLPDGSLNAFRIRRLKRKLGTRSMASGEVDWLGSVGYPIGDLTGGFKLIVGTVLQTSRVYNAMVTSGSMVRAFTDAEAYARHREAFGNPIRSYPEIRRTLARQKACAWASVASSLHVTAISERIATGQGSQGDRAALRMLTNENKYWTSIRNTQVVRDGIEILGGNGAIEDFSLFPRLLRDALVLESWEGAHNVLCNQVLRDSLRYQMHEPMLGELRSLVDGAPDGLQRQTVVGHIDAVQKGFEKLPKLSPEEALGSIRSLIDHSAVAHQSACLLHMTTTLGQAGKEASRVLDYYLAVFPGVPFQGADLALADACLEGGSPLA
jgi:alkylation response protein AidB-like acyl-CoA dehydrogenase